MTTILADGFVLADKPAGMGSAALVGRLKRELGGVRVGHTGTLDRFASGLMLLLTGRATSLADEFLHADKSYLARFQFGRFTDTHDSLGETTASADAAETAAFCAREERRIAAAIERLASLREQQPPLFSALKRDGRRFSDRARAGEDELPAVRPIRVYSVRIVATDLSSGVFDVDLSVSGGTYIRAFARDLSAELNFPLHLAELRRHRLGTHNIEDTGVWIPDAEGRPVPRDVREALPGWARLAVDATAARAVLQGRPLAVDSLNWPDRTPPALANDQTADVFLEDEQGTLLAWARRSEAGLRYMRVFGT
jgi:tRNA pseudouridine55 synthase